MIPVVVCVFVRLPVRSGGGMSGTRQRTARSGWRLGVFDAGASVSGPAMPISVLSRQETETTCPGVDRRDVQRAAARPLACCVFSKRQRIVGPPICKRPRRLTRWSRLNKREAIHE